MNTTAEPSPARYPVRLVALRTGLSPHLLRAWERRYGVVTPGRSEGGQRLYSDLDIERLGRLKRLVERGHAISRIASLPLEALAEMEQAFGAGPAPDADSSGRVEDEARARTIQDFSDRALRATLALDAAALQEVLERAAVTLGVPDFLETVAATTLEDIGHGWTERSVTIAQEHLATIVFRRVFGWLLGLYQIEGGARRLLVATPPGERHELGALMAAISAALEGWSVTYLGADLPVEELLRAIGQTGADAVALSIVHADDQRGLLSVLRAIRTGMPRDVALLVGGAGVNRVQAGIELPGVHLLDSLADLRPALQRVAVKQPA
jgi:DNA-binding transcriptional MerR regulator/methylmalonyl-CoA mutase cobalamin-binding subunit